MSEFATNLFDRNGNTGTAYVLRHTSGRDFEEYDHAEAVQLLEDQGYQEVMSAFESHVLDEGSGRVVIDGIIKVIPAIRDQEKAALRQKGIEAQPILH